MPEQRPPGEWDWKDTDEVPKAGAWASGEVLMLFLLFPLKEKYLQKHLPVFCVVKQKGKLTDVVS